MKKWRCPKCGATRKYFGALILKICYRCQEVMEVIEYE